MTTSFSPDDLSADLTAWLATAHARISVNPERWPGVFVTLRQGEIAYLSERNEDGWITVFESSRGEEPLRVFRTPSWDVVERFLANAVGSAARFRAGVPGTVRVPFTIEELPPGAVLQPVGGSLEQLIVDGVVIGEYEFSPQGVLVHADAVRAAHYGTAPVTLIAQSYLDPEGHPLFGLRDELTGRTMEIHGPPRPLTTSESSDAALLIEAVRAYTGYGVARTPRDDQAAVLALLPGAEGEALLARVTLLAAESEAIEAAWDDADGDSLLPVFARKFSALHPGLPDEVVRALAWRWAYDRFR